MIAVRKRGKPQIRPSAHGIQTDSPSDEEDEAAELMRELEKIKRERLEQKEKEVIIGLSNISTTPTNPA